MPSSKINETFSYIDDNMSQRLHPNTSRRESTAAKLHNYFPRATPPPPTAFGTTLSISYASGNLGIRRSVSQHDVASYPDNPTAIRAGNQRSVIHPTITAN